MKLRHYFVIPMNKLKKWNEIKRIYNMFYRETVTQFTYNPSEKHEIEPKLEEHLTREGDLIISMELDKFWLNQIDLILEDEIYE